MLVNTVKVWTRQQDNKQQDNKQQDNKTTR